MTFPELDEWVRSNVHSARWSAVPVWDLAAEVYHQVRGLDLPPGLVDAVASANADAFLDDVAAASRSVLLDLYDRPGTDVTVLSNEDLWAQVRSAQGVRGARAALRTQRLRHERLAQVYVRTAGVFAQHLRDELETASWVGVEASVCDGARLLGDMHARGSVVALYQGASPRVMYKPRSMSADRLVADATRVLREHLPDVAPHHPMFIDRETHGWQRYATFAEPERLDTFYYRFGGLIAVAYLLQISDLHYENVKCVEGAPTILDPECALGQVAGRMLSIAGGSMERQQFNTLSTQLVPNWSARLGVSAPIDFSALGSRGATDRANPVRNLERDERGALRWTLEESDVAPVRPTLPQRVADGASVPYQGYEPEIVRGFEDASAALPSALDEMLGGADAQVRVLRRSTAVYTALLESAGQIDLPRHASEVETSVGADFRLLNWLHSAEEDQLDHGVVPTFELSVPEGLLRAGDGVSYALAPAIARQAVAELGESGPLRERIAVQSTVLRRSLLLGVGADESRAEPFGTHAGGSTSPVAGTSAIDRLIPLLVGRLADEALRVEGQQTQWLTSQILGEGRYRLSLTGLDAYAGQAGIVYALAVAGLEDPTAARLCDDLAGELLATIDARLDQTVDQIPSNLGWRGGMGTGLVGVVLALLAAQDLRGTSWPDTEWNSRLARLLPLIGEPGDHFDFLEGDAGRAYALARIAELSGNADAHAIGEKLLEGTLSLVTSELSAGRAAFGLAHGLSGVAHALRRYVGSRPEWGAMAGRLLAAEEALAVHRADESGSWCRGTAGRLHGHLLAGGDGEMLDALRSRNLEAAIGGLTYCHGVLGQVALRGSSAYVERFGARDHRHAERAALELLDRVGPEDGRPDYARVPGLFTGTAGLLVFLCSLRDGAEFDLSGLGYAPSLV